MSASPYREADIRRLIADVAAGTTDAVLLAAQTGRRIRVLEGEAMAGGTATDLTLNSKPSGAGVAISPVFPLGVRTPLPLPFNPHGWCETAPSEGLTCTTGAGATVAVLLTVALVGSSEGEVETLLLEDTGGSVPLLEDGTPLMTEAA